MLKFSEAVLVVLIIASGTCFWLLARLALPGLGTGLWGWTMLALALNLSFLSLGFFLLPFWLGPLAIFFSASPLFFLFSGEASYYGLLAAAVSLAAIPASWRARREAEARLKFSVSAILRKSLPFFLTIVSVLLAVAFYPRGYSPGFSDVIPKSFFERSLGIAGRTLPFEVFLPFPVPDLYDFLIKTLEERFGAFKSYLPFVYSLGIFAVSRSVFALAGWASIAFAWILVKLGRSAGILVFDRRQLSQEYLRLK